jgi:DNA-binding response OmpR family regulator
MKILLVDDEEKFVSRLAERLEIRGFEVDWTTTCDGALTKVENNEYNIAVLDVKMPRLSGIDLKKRLEKLAPKMKFVFVSGHGSEEDYDIAMREGAFYLIKPFKIEALVEKIKEALNP